MQLSSEPAWTVTGDEKAVVPVPSTTWTVLFVSACHGCRAARVAAPAQTYIEVSAGRLTIQVYEVSSILGHETRAAAEAWPPGMTER